jgi:CheY-like chemotaxis protein
VQIAILEDKKDDAALAVEALAHAGHTIRTFAAGDALLAELRRGTFDLLLLDWNLPSVSGLEAAAPRGSSRPARRWRRRRRERHQEGSDTAVHATPATVPLRTPPGR